MHAEIGAGPKRLDHAHRVAHDAVVDGAGQHRVPDVELRRQVVLQRLGSRLPGQEEGAAPTRAQLGQRPARQLGQPGHVFRRGGSRSLHHIRSLATLAR